MTGVSPHEFSLPVGNGCRQGFCRLAGFCQARIFQTSMDFQSRLLTLFLCALRAWSCKKLHAETSYGKGNGQGESYAGRVMFDEVCCAWNHLRRPVDWQGRPHRPSQYCRPVSFPEFQSTVCCKVAV